ncbi:hypothetical protein D5S18_00995 [Nocardia panacis]|uniref:Uncharacterized protein n=1 Tax=Nocardia panacis TaxID=2340916 RepID=A0A3A4KWS2_9NOCA|nr:hypothetical protein [Nocardia panacis]RJO79881.1 hypothetical protein D5S18_00995 [Nocardia panacis]
MRLRTRHCRIFEYTVLAGTPDAIDLEPADIGVRHPFFDCLLLTVGVEHDNPRVAEIAVPVVRRIVARAGAWQIVVNGFLDAAERDVENRADARAILSELSERLEERGELVHLMPFGWVNTWYADLLDTADTEISIHVPLFDDTYPNVPLSRTCPTPSVRSRH